MKSARGLLLGIEIGGTKLQLGLGRADGTILALDRRKVKPSLGAEGIRAQIAAAVDPLLARLGANRSQVAAAGIGFGGPVDAERGQVLRSFQIEGWGDFPLASWCAEALGFERVAVQNDADTAALGEARFGAGVGLSPVLYMTIGSGIGGGLVIDGRIYRGAGAGALEIGHLRVMPDPAREPRWFELEEVASGWAIGRSGQEWARLRLQQDGPRPERLLQCVQGDPDRITGEVVAAVAADRLASEPERAAMRAILDRAIEAVSQALAQAVALVCPRIIILGGGVSLLGESAWHGPIRDRLKSRVFPPFRDAFDLVAAKLGEEVVVHGALALASDLAGRRPTGQAAPRAAQ